MRKPGRRRANEKHGGGGHEVDGTGIGYRSGPADRSRRREEIRADLERGRAAFREMLDSLSEADLGRKSGSAWTVREIATHVVLAVEQVPALLGQLRYGRDHMNYPLRVFDPAKRAYTRWQARALTGEVLARRLDAAYPPILAVLARSRTTSGNARAGLMGRGRGPWSGRSSISATTSRSTAARSESCSDLELCCGGGSLSISNSTGVSMPRAESRNLAIMEGRSRADASGALEKQRDTA